MRSKITGILATILSALATAQVAYGQLPGQGYEPPRYNDRETHFEKSEQSFGRFTVVRYIKDCRNVPVLDGGYCLTKEARLEWHDSSGMIGISFVDNGGSIQSKGEAKSVDGKNICLMAGILVGYDPKPSTSDNWRRLQPFIAQRIRRCAIVTPSNLSRALAEAEASGGDYVSAASAWKNVSVELFGSERNRCVAERIMKPYTMPPRFECVKYSQPRPRS